MPALTTYLSQRGFVGLASEAAKGTPVAATSWLPLLDESLARDPGILLEKLLRQSRDTAFTPTLGAQQITGKLDTPLYVDQGLALLAAAVGTDTYQSASAVGTLVAIGGSGVAAGATTVTLQTQTTPAIAGGDFVQLQQATGAPSATNLAEVHKVALVSGSGPYALTLAAGESVVNAYGATGQAGRVAAGTTAFAHTLLPDQPNAATWKTLTVEKNLGGLTSLQYAGAVVSKAALTVDSKAVAKLSYDLMAMGDAQVTPSTPSFGTSAPLALPNAAVSLFGVADSGVASFSLEVDNGAKGYWTFNGGALPSLIVPAERKVTGKFTSVVQSMSYYNDMAAGTTGAFVLTLTQGSNTVVFTLPACVITKLSVPLKAGEVLLYDVAFQATNAGSGSINAAVTNGTWLPLV